MAKSITRVLLDISVMGSSLTPWKFCLEETELVCKTIVQTSRLTNHRKIIVKKANWSVKVLVSKHNSDIPDTNNLDQDNYTYN